MKITGAARVKLRKYRPSDARALMKLRVDQDVQSALMAPVFSRSKREARKWLTRATLELDRVFFIVEVNDETAGFIQLSSTSDRPGVLKLGIALLPKFRGVGVGGTAIRLVAEADSTRAKALNLDVADSNVKALRLYRQLGFEETTKTTIATFEGPKAARTMELRLSHSNSMMILSKESVDGKNSKDTINNC